eukprot:2259940-Amphidinium_carterae.1
MDTKKDKKEKKKREKRVECDDETFRAYLAVFCSDEIAHEVFTKLFGADDRFGVAIADLVAVKAWEVDPRLSRTTAPMDLPMPGFLRKSSDTPPKQ